MIPVLCYAMNVINAIETNYGTNKVLFAYLHKQEY